MLARMVTYWVSLVASPEACCRIDRPWLAPEYARTADCVNVTRLMGHGVRTSVADALCEPEEVQFYGLGTEEREEAHAPSPSALE